MEYVEILRARRVLFWYGLVLLVQVLITAATVFFGHPSVHRGNSTAHFSSIVVAALFGGAIVATFVGAGLNAESGRTAIVWTRPKARDAIAWRYIAVDVVTILIGYALMLVTVVAVTAIIGILDQFTYDVAQSARFLALGVGAALMWYALISLVAARLPGRGGLIAGLSWAAFIVIIAVREAPFPLPLHALIYALNYIDPLAYIGATGTDQPLLPLAQPVRIAMVYAIAIVALAGSVRLWSTREA
ncbi:MAG: hypothetical protein JWM87_1273 [Candidatus Eremiobacteraeota bacterium]|nr:hypothetical protein [Candidatus Eremiobacteraeota bacterium]